MECEYCGEPLNEEERAIYTEWASRAPRFAKPLCRLDHIVHRGDEQVGLLVVVTQEDR
jgi:hypothetical protein